MSIHPEMQSQNPIPMPRPQPSMVDRLRLTLREVDEGLQLNPNYLAAREFRRFLLRAIDELESKQLNAAA
jgi:hypothetical protein